MSKTDNAGSSAAACHAETAALPLNAVRVFVEAARAGSLSGAARRLGMTQSGVSHHVATLEKHLGARLFVRAAGGVRLTDDGRIYYDAVHEALDTLALATRQMSLRPPSAGARLVVRTSLPSFATHVLLPELSAFSAQSGLSVDVVTSLAPPETGARYDVLVTRDLDVDADNHWQLAGETLIAVAAPGVAADLRAMPPADWPFVVARSRPDVLAQWAAGQDLDAGAVRVVAGFEHYYLAIAAALGGLGALVVPRLLVRDILARGLLVDLGWPAVRGDASYKAAVNPAAVLPEAAVAFCRWLSGFLKSEVVG